jgi:hypothetical protein
MLLNYKLNGQDPSLSLRVFNNYKMTKSLGVQVLSSLGYSQKRGTST